MIAMDADDVSAIRQRLRVASEDLGEAVPQLPGAAAYGPAVLGSAVASFESALRRRAEQLGTRWSELDTGVQDTLKDMGTVEDEIVAGLGRFEGNLGSGDTGRAGGPGGSIRASGPLQ